ncbi:MAG: alcohol dehydrogenase catalytic domain-containing protein [Verrucomicrobia bacterium]|nr:alcohol dehydrogenase catalytic domain-containing protein [Verrucomicrobiota bacterium]
MRALLYPEFGRMEMADVPAPPSPAADEVTLRVAACGICGSELEAFKLRSPRRPPPLVLGHEFCGVVETCGSEVRDWAPGARVVCNALVPCLRCVRCARGDTHLCATRQIFGMNRPGAFAERVNAPARCLLPWPDTLTAEEACLAEPLGNGVHVARLTAHLRAEVVVIVGAGPIGLFCQQALQVLRGARTIVADLSDDRLAVAKRLGAMRVVNPRTGDLEAIVREETGGEGADLAVDAVGGAATKRSALEVVRPGGAAVWIGLHENPLTLDSFGVTLPEKQIFGSYAARLDDLRLALDWMSTGRVDARTWTTRFALADGTTAFDRALAARGTDLKCILTP